MQPKVFLSYSWKDKELADTIDKDWEAVGISLTRDVRDLTFKQNIKEFMRRVTKSDFVILLISKGYLESPNCMHEAIEMLNNRQFKKKILPILTADAKLSDPLGRLQYIEYWEGKLRQFNSALLSISSVENTAGVQKELAHLRHIRSSIDQFTTEIQDILCATWPTVKENGYSEIFRHIGYRDSDVLEECSRISYLRTEEDQELALDELSIKYPNDPRIFFTKSVLAYNVGKFKKCRLLLERVMALDPASWQSRHNLGIVLSEQLGDTAGAKKAYQQALAIEPKAAISLHGLGRTFYLENDYDKAREYYESALGIDPDYAPAHANMAHLLDSRYCKYDKARDHYERALEINPSLADAHYNYGRLLANYYGNYDLSYKHLRRAAQLVPNGAEIHLSLAKLLGKHLRRAEESKKHYETAVRLDPSLEITSRHKPWD